MRTDERPETSVAADVRRAVEQRLPAAVEFLRALVQAPSLLGDEEPAQALVEERMRAIGFDVRSVTTDVSGRQEAGYPWVPYEGRRNVVGELRGESDATVVLNGHVDVVSVGPEEQWSVDPFGGEIRDGRLYGRGAGDMKGGVAAMLLGIEAARALGPLPATVVYQSVIEEESTGNGALAAGLQTPAPDAALIAEPSAGDVSVAAVGVIYARITIDGAAGHAMSSDARANPIDEAYVAIAALRELEAAYNADPDPVFADVDRPYLLNIGSLHAGDWPSSTPSRAVVEARLGFPVRLRPEEAQERLRGTVLRAVPSARVEFMGQRAHGYAFDPDAPFLRVLRDCHERFHGSPPAIAAAKGTTDLRFFQRPFPVASGAACYGPEGGNFHGIDEWVDLASIADVATVIALTLRSYRPGGGA